MVEKQSVNRQWLLKNRPQNGEFVNSSYFEEKSTPISELADGQVLAKVLYISFDPTQRGWLERDTYIPKIPLGEVVNSFGVMQVIDSKHKSWSPGDIALGITGWQEFVLFEPDNSKGGMFDFNKIPGHLDPLRMLTLSLTGLTAYFGMLEVGKLKAGDTVLVSGAAGATGSFAGQIAKIMGAKQVVGIAGGSEKCKWLTQTAGFDAAIDYKNEDVGQRVQQLFPDGIDLFFDNVGGEILDSALANLAKGARIALCGAISQYQTADDKTYGLKNTMSLVLKTAQMQGFLVMDFKDNFLKGLLVLNKWIDQGKLVMAIDEQEGFENIPKTLERLFSGSNTGKQVLKLSNKPLPTNTSMIAKTFMQLLAMVY